LLDVCSKIFPISAQNHRQPARGTDGKAALVASDFKRGHDQELTRGFPGLLARWQQSGLAGNQALAATVNATELNGMIQACRRRSTWRGLFKLPSKNLCACGRKRRLYISPDGRRCAAIIPGGAALLRSRSATEVNSAALHWTIVPENVLDCACAQTSAPFSKHETFLHCFWYSAAMRSCRAHLRPGHDVVGGNCWANICPWERLAGLWSGAYLGPHDLAAHRRG